MRHERGAEGMATNLKDGERLVQIGVTALRGPDGKPLPSVPMYIIVPGEAVNRDSGMTDAEEALCTDIAGIMAGKFAQYVEGVKATGAHI